MREIEYNIQNNRSFYNKQKANLNDSSTSKTNISMNSCMQNIGTKQHKGSDHSMDDHYFQGTQQSNNLNSNNNPIIINNKNNDNSHPSNKNPAGNHGNIISNIHTNSNVKTSDNLNKLSCIKENSASKKYLNSQGALVNILKKSGMKVKKKKKSDRGSSNNKNNGYIVEKNDNIKDHYELNNFMNNQMIGMYNNGGVHQQNRKDGGSGIRTKQEQKDKDLLNAYIDNIRSSNYFKNHKEEGSYKDKEIYDRERDGSPITYYNPENGFFHPKDTHGMAGSHVGSKTKLSNKLLKQRVNNNHTDKNNKLNTSSKGSASPKHNKKLG